MMYAIVPCVGSLKDCIERMRMTDPHPCKSPSLWRILTWSKSNLGFTADNIGFTDNFMKILSEQQCHIYSTFSSWLIKRKTNDGTEFAKSC